MTHYIVYRVEKRTGKTINLFTSDNYTVADSREKELTHYLYMLELNTQYYITLEVKT